MIVGILTVMVCVLIFSSGYFYTLWRNADNEATKWLKYSNRLEEQKQRYIKRIENFEDMQDMNLKMSIMYAKTLLECESIIGSAAVNKVKDDLIILQRVKEAGVDRWIAERTENVKDN